MNAELWRTIIGQGVVADAQQGLFEDNTQLLEQSQYKLRGQITVSIKTKLTIFEINIEMEAKMGKDHRIFRFSEKFQIFNTLKEES